jgi:hypothetical protein
VPKFFFFDLTQNRGDLDHPMTLGLLGLDFKSAASSLASHTLRRLIAQADAV